MKRISTKDMQLRRLLTRGKCEDVRVRFPMRIETTHYRECIPVIKFYGADGLVMRTFMKRSENIYHPNSPNECKKFDLNPCRSYLSQWRDWGKDSTEERERRREDREKRVNKIL